MERLIYHFKCLDGVCDFTGTCENDVLDYAFDSTIAEIPSRSGQLDKEQTARFLKELDEANIERWEKEYEPDLTPIEDAVRWELEYEKDSRSFSSKGEETYEPYGYEHLIKAMMICDQAASYFMI